MADSKREEEYRSFEEYKKRYFGSSVSGPRRGKRAVGFGVILARESGKKLEGILRTQDNSADKR
jgi:hypothetical protein